MGKTLHFMQRHIKKGIVTFLAAAMILSAASSAFAANSITVWALAGGRRALLLHQAPLQRTQSQAVLRG